MNAPRRGAIGAYQTIPKLLRRDQNNQGNSKARREKYYFTLLKSNMYSQCLIEDSKIRFSVDKTMET